MPPLTVLPAKRNTHFSSFKKQLFLLSLSLKTSQSGRGGEVRAVYVQLLGSLGGSVGG